MLIEPSAPTVTSNVADVYPAALTVMVAVPAATEVITIFPPSIVTVATPVSLDVTLVPIKPKVAASPAILLSVCGTKPGSKGCGQAVTQNVINRTRRTCPIPAAGARPGIAVKNRLFFILCPRIIWIFVLLIVRFMIHDISGMLTRSKKSPSGDFRLRGIKSAV
jgi:hypothetical protein